MRMNTKLVVQCMVWGLLATLFLPTTEVRGDSHFPEEPNVILIMSDDQGYETVGAYGAQDYETPNLDRLAETGMRFDRAHSLPICTPTRVQIMSGRYNSRNYIGFGRMDPDIYTFGNLFQDAGYATFVGGKWQLAAFDSRTEALKAPYHFGFDEYCLWQLSRTPRHGTEIAPRYANPGLEINGKEHRFTDGQYGPKIVNNHVLDFIERHQDESFFVYYPMILPHWPFEPTPDSEEWDPSFRSEDRTEKGRYRSKKYKKYFQDMVAYTDKMVGRVIDKLDELGLREDTLVIFTGDNGTYRSITSRINDRKVTGNKGYPTDKGTHVPLIANWPNVVESGTVNRDLIGFTYFFPTLAEVAGIEVPGHKKLDGQSFAPLLLGEDVEMRNWLYQWYYRGNDPGDKRSGEFARTKRYKLYVDGGFYDLEKDIRERNPLNPEQLTEEQRKIKNRLRNIIDRYTRPGFRDD